MKNVDVMGIKFPPGIKVFIFENYEKLKLTQLHFHITKKSTSIPK